MIRVGVLRGGASDHYQESLQSGAYVLHALPRDTYEPVDIFVDTEGVWHLSGVPVTPSRLAHRVDVIWNALSGYYGSDGKLQQYLEDMGIPYTGSNAVASAGANNRKLLEERLAHFGIQASTRAYIDEWENEPETSVVAQSIYKKLSPPWIVRPISRGISTQEITCQTFEKLVEALTYMRAYEIPAVVEQKIIGTQVSVVTIPGMRHKKEYTLIPSQEVASKRKLSRQENESLAARAYTIHTALNLGHFSCIQFIRTPRGQLFVHDIQTVPAMHENSVLVKGLAEVGSSFDEFSRHVLAQIGK